MTPAARWDEMMTADERGLLNAVLESPADDTPRLVLADWYEENGQADRATFIRAQIELARLVAADAYDTDEYVAASRDEASVGDDQLVEWARAAAVPLRDGRAGVEIVADAVVVHDPGDSLLAVGFHRGFVRQLAVGVDRLGDWLTVLSAAPVERITLNADPLTPIDVRVRRTADGWAADLNGGQWRGRPGPPAEPGARNWATRHELVAGLVPWLVEFWRRRATAELPDPEPGMYDENGEYNPRLFPTPHHVVLHYLRLALPPTRDAP